MEQTSFEVLAAGRGLCGPLVGDKVLKDSSVSELRSTSVREVDQLPGDRLGLDGRTVVGRDRWRVL